MTDFMLTDAHNWTDKRSKFFYVMVLCKTYDAKNNKIMLYKMFRKISGSVSNVITRKCTGERARQNYNDRLLG